MNSSHDAGDETTASARFWVHVGSFSPAYLQTLGPSSGHEVHKGSPYTAEVQELTKEPFPFDGWYADEELEHPLLDGTELVDDLILYGEWTQVTVTEEEKEDDRSADGDKESSEKASPVKTEDRFFAFLIPDDGLRSNCCDYWNGKL